ncbi:ClbS/DfsB family four-helix bundle protein [Timonella sp. A28]|uniref:ClbS/DfsB family four-helix bundle protein n=1 Tax=Timonella sp. A28 TaxID=3442640 RepID=UPI003EBC1DFC
MAIPRSKDELLAAVTSTYALLVADLARVPEESAREKTMPGHKAGSLMSPADLVAYLIGWNQQVLLWHEQRAQGVEPDFPAAGFTWNQLGELAQHFYAQRTHTSWTELLTEYEAVKTAIVALIEQLSDDELYGTVWYKNYTAGRMIQFNTSSPYANARQRIRAWLRANNH